MTLVVKKKRPARTSRLPTGQLGWQLHRGWCEVGAYTHKITIIKVACEYHSNNEPNRALLKVFLLYIVAYLYLYIFKPTCIHFLRTHQLDALRQAS